MTKLENLYIDIKKLEEAGLQLTPEQLKLADELEEQLIRSEVLPAISKDIEPRLAPIQRELVLVVEYKPGEPISVALSRKRNITEILNAKTLTQSSSTPVKSSRAAEPVQPHIPQKHIENATKGLRVTFPDGTVIWNQSAIKTYIETIKKIGFERVSKLGLTHSGYNIVSKKKRPTEPGKIWQHEIDGWYVYSNISNDKKISDLKFISDYFYLKLKIEELKPKR